MATGITQTDVSFELPDGHRMPASLALPATREARPGILVIHEIFGLNDDMRRITRRFAELGYVALAPDLYAGGGSRTLCVARAIWALKSGEGPAYKHMSAALAYLRDREDVLSSHLAAVGFCMGGGFVLNLALREQLEVVAPFYGDVPSEADALRGVCPVVASYGGRDAVFAPQGKRLDRHLKQLDVPHDVKIYPRAGHSFMSQHEPGFMDSFYAIGPMKVSYDPDAAEDAWNRMQSFFSEHLDPTATR